jgi:hypothetical protein
MAMTFHKAAAARMVGGSDVQMAMTTASLMAL